jgi:hypothetical protein
VLAVGKLCQAGFSNSRIPQASPGALRSRPIEKINPKSELIAVQNAKKHRPSNATKC